MSATTFDDFILAVRAAEVDHSGFERCGQSAFNVLNRLRPDLSEKVRGTHFDPFYDTGKLSSFFEWVKERW